MNSKKNTNTGAFILCIIIFVALQIFQTRLSTMGLNKWNGLVSQFQILSTILLVLSNHKRGYIAGVVLYVVSMIFIVMATITHHSQANTPSAIAVSICTIIILSIIYNYVLRNSKMHDELMEKYEQEIENKRVLQEKDQVLSYLAYYDRLTQMPNRHLFMENLEENISRNKQCAVVCVNLDDFRQINDTYGLAVGDELIKTYAERIEAIISGKNFGARLSGDEFGIILGSENSNQDVISFVGKLQGVFTTPIDIDGKPVGVSSSIGVAMFPRDATGAEEVLRCSEKAMFMSKNNGKNKVCFYSPVV